MILEVDIITTEDFDIDVGASASSNAAAAGKLDLAVVQLNKAGTVLGRNTPIATIDALVADYSGYADGTITWTGSRKTDDGKLELTGTVPEFVPSGSGVTNMIGSVAIYNAGKTKVYAVANFDGVGLPMNSTLSSIIAAVALRFSDVGKLRVIT